MAGSDVTCRCCDDTILYNRVVSAQYDGHCKYWSFTCRYGLNSNSRLTSSGNHAVSILLAQGVWRQVCGRRERPVMKLSTVQCFYTRFCVLHWSSQRKFDFKSTKEQQEKPDKAICVDRLAVRYKSADKTRLRIATKLQALVYHILQPLP